MKYVPSLTDTRVLKKIEKILKWAAPFIRNSRVGLSRQTIRKVFGNQEEPLPAFLFDMLFKRDANSTYNNSAYNPMAASKTYDYEPSLAGFTYLQDSLLAGEWQQLGVYVRSFEGAIALWKHASHLVDKQAALGHEEQLSTGIFVYQDNDCGRKFHELQQLEKADNFRAEFWSKQGMAWDCDIDNAQTRILTQWADQQKLSVPHMQEYVDNKAAIRNRAAFIGKCDPKLAKTLLTAILNAMKLTKYNVAMVTGDWVGAAAIVNDPWFRGLANEVMIVHSMLPEDNFYFKVERQIMECAENYMRSKGVKNFNMFDGSITSERVDELADVIAEATGWRVMFTWEKFTVLEAAQGTRAARMIRDVNRLSELIDAPISWVAVDVGYGYEVKVAERGTVTRANAADLKKTLRKAVAEEAVRKNIEFAQNLTPEQLKELQS